MKADKDYRDAPAKEVVDLHVFFEDWFRGSCENNEQVWGERLHARMDEDFYIVLPGGHGLSGSGFWPEMQGLYGSNPDFQINIRNIQQRPCSQGDWVILTYEEWQKGAKYSTPPNNARVATAILIKDASAPNGLRWVHVHETWLPPEQLSAESFDW